jgi:hypothetical protein
MASVVRMAMLRCCVVCTAMMINMVWMGVSVPNGHAVHVECALIVGRINYVWVNGDVDLRCMLRGLGMGCFRGDLGRGECV